MFSESVTSEMIGVAKEEFISKIKVLSISALYVVHIFFRFSPSIPRHIYYSLISQIAPTIGNNYKPFTDNIKRNNQTDIAMQLLHDTCHDPWIFMFCFLPSSYFLFYFGNSVNFPLPAPHLLTFAHCLTCHSFCNVYTDIYILYLYYNICSWVSVPRCRIIPSHPCSFLVLV